jgi:hypothetical protein
VAYVGLFREGLLDDERCLKLSENKIRLTKKKVKEGKRRRREILAFD